MTPNAQVSRHSAITNDKVEMRAAIFLHPLSIILGAEAQTQPMFILFG